MNLSTSAARVESTLLGACGKVLHARQKLEEAECARAEDERRGDRAREAARAGYFAALENYFYAGERAAGRDPERDPDD
jgi:hypothetical protein